MVFDSLVCLPQCMSGIHLCLKFKPKDKKKNLKCEKIYVSLLYFSCQLWKHCHQTFAGIGHSDEPKSLLPNFGPNQHKIQSSGSKFKEIKEK